MCIVHGYNGPGYNECKMWVRVLHGDIQYSCQSNYSKSFISCLNNIPIYEYAPDLLLLFPLHEHLGDLQVL